MKIDKVRVGVGDPTGMHSFVWDIIAQGNHVYLLERSTGEMLKVSLHLDNEGIGRFAFLKKHFDQLSSSNQTTQYDQKINSWDLPKVPEAGAVHVVSIFFPTSFLRTAPCIPIKRKKGKKIFWIAPAATGQAVEIGVFLSKQDPFSIEGKFIKLGTTPILHSELPNGIKVIIVGRNVIFDDDLARVSIPEQINQGRLKVYDLSNEPSSGNDHVDISTYIWNEPDDEGGILKIWEFHNLVYDRSSGYSFRSAS